MNFAHIETISDRFGLWKPIYEQLCAFKMLMQSFFKMTDIWSSLRRNNKLQYNNFTPFG